MRLEKLLVILCFLLPLKGLAQVPELSPLSKISVLTCGSGDQLYSTFGHSAFRVKDPTLGIDVVYNYGVFDFNSNNFYGKFAKGKLDYTLARQQYSNFIREYKYDQRWVNEQLMQLSQGERNELFQFLENNYLPENRAYQYDFFYNNCATKIWDVLETVYGKNLQFNENYLQKLYTHRELIHQNMPTNSWSAFGIDLALGAVIDDIATPKEHMFLPAYIMRQLNTSKLNGTLLAPNKVSIFKPESHDNKINFLRTPLFWSLVFMILVMVLTYLDYTRKRRRKWLDFGLFFTTGIAGVVIFFLWFLTDHTATASNYNILWAFPLNLNLAFFVWRNTSFSKWVGWYIPLLLSLLLITVILWTLGVQVFSPVLLPVLLALGVRYTFLYHWRRKQFIPTAK